MRSVGGAGRVRADASMANLATQHRGIAALPPDTAVCIGAFDGLHLGHQALLARAATLGSAVAMVSFDPHPLQVLAPARAPALLQTPVQRRRVAAHYGVAQIVLLPFDETMSTMSPQQFTNDVIAEGLRPTAVVVGRDFRFGHRRAGTPAVLAEQLPSVKVAIVDPVQVPDGAAPVGTATDDAAVHKLGSTAVRKAVAAGEVTRVTAMLGRPYAIEGRVARGDQRGRTIGFPTANVQSDNAIIPPPGVYATVTTVWSEGSPDFGAVWPSVTNIGTSPTFTEQGAPVRVESHILGHDLGERLYDVHVEVSFVERLRAERRFDSADALVEQLTVDANAARNLVDAGALASVVAPREVAQ